MASFAGGLSEAVDILEEEINVRNAFSFNSDFIGSIPDIVMNGSEEDWVKASNAIKAGSKMFQC